MLHYSSSLHILREGKENVQPFSSWVSLLGSPVRVGADPRMGMPLCCSWGVLCPSLPTEALLLDLFCLHGGQRAVQ